MLRWIQSDAPGEEIGRDLAEYAWEHSSLEDVEALQELGVETIVEVYRRTPAWFILAPMETKFRRLVEGFVAWEPPEDDEEEDEPESPEGGEPEDTYARV
jgi:hypothetical protein